MRSSGVFSSSVLLLALPALAAAQPSVNVPGCGKVLGAVSPVSAKIATFKGIPYAKPPVKERRWQVPEPAEPWAPKALNATAFGNQCLQGGKVQPEHDEDCLFLNVYAPLSANAVSQLPVMLWIHGGAYNSGSSNGYPGDSLVAASKGTVVVVTINYRLNVFGFLGSHEIQSRSERSTAGNFGIEDQRAGTSTSNLPLLVTSSSFLIDRL
jgi:para-nitrobenzyl esterase